MKKSFPQKSIRILVGIVALILLISIGYLLTSAYFLVWLVDASCGTTDVFQSEISPNGLYRAVVYNYSCFPSPINSIEVSIVPWFVETPDHDGNIAVFAIRGKWNPKNVIVTWKDNASLQVDTYGRTYITNGVKLKEKHWLFISIDYPHFSQD